MAGLETMREHDRRVLLLAIGFCLFLAAVDQTIISTALPSILDQIGSIQDVSLIINSYLVASVTFGPIYGKLSDVFGRRNILILAILFFLLGSILATLGNSPIELAGARFIQGIGGGGLFVLAFTIASDLAAPRNRGKIQGLFASVFGLASISGPFVGGLILEYFDWRWIFLFKIPFSIFSLSIVVLFLKQHDSKKFEPINYLSLVCLSTFLCTLVFLLSSMSETSLLTIKNNALAFLNLAAGTILFLSEKNSTNPLFNLKLRNNNIKFYLISSFFTGIILLSVSAFIQVYLQIALNYKPLYSGCFLISLTLGIICSTTITGKLISNSGRYRVYPLIGGGFLFIGCTLIVIFIKIEPTHFIILLLALFILGVGLGPQLSVVTAAIQNSSPRDKVGLITGTLTTTRQLGGIIGLCVLNLLFSESIKYFSQNQSNLSLLHQGAKSSSLSKVLNPNFSDSSNLIIETYKNGTISVFLFLGIISIVICILNFFVKEVTLRDK